MKTNLLIALSVLFVFQAKAQEGKTETIALKSVYAYSCDLKYMVDGKERSEKHFISKPFDKSTSTQEKLRQDLKLLRVKFEPTLSYRSLDIYSADKLPYRDQGTSLFAYFLDENATPIIRTSALNEIRKLVMKPSTNAEWIAKQGELIERNFLLAASNIAVKAVGPGVDTRSIQYMIHINAKKQVFAITAFPQGSLPVPCERVNHDINLSVNYSVGASIQ